MPKVKGGRKIKAAIAKAFSKTNSNNITVKSLISELGKLFSEQADGNVAVGMKSYMRNQYEFFGLNAPKRRAIQKEVTYGLVLDVQQLHTLLKELWNKTEREYHLFAVDYATLHSKTLIGTNIHDAKLSLDVVKYLITHKSWWDTVDNLAASVVGPLVMQYRKQLTTMMDDWIKDENMWLRRTALLHQLKYGDKVDQGQLFRYCLSCAHEEEFFIRKAIGWALRNYYRVAKSSVETFVLANKDVLSKLSKAEALKHSPMKAKVI